MNTRGEVTQAIRRFILKHIEEHSADIAAFTAEIFGVSRQSVSRHLRNLVAQGLITATGKTKSRRYYLVTLVEESFSLMVTPEFEESVVWHQRLLPHLDGIAPNVLTICDYGFTEMLNNVIDHSESERVNINLIRNANKVSMTIRDFGVGVFNKIQLELNLNDPRHALLELSKGKLTTDPQLHTGEGIFFTSRMFDNFHIISGSIGFTQEYKEDGWLFDDIGREHIEGTIVSMDIRTDAEHTIQEIFDRFASGEDDYSFNKTHVVIKLSRYEGENLISRSQAKRILSRVDLFREVSLDFQDIDTIGPSFADEIFRVFPNQHPEILFIPVNTSPQVQRAIQRVRQNSSNTK